jgi:hypothetical protein
MKRPKDPEIKLPKLKAPGFLVDLYYDLDERHLLPVVAILIVAIVAIPLLLSGSSDSEAGDSSAETGATESAASNPKQSAVMVAKATPRLRDYQRRLDHLKPKDPFKPHYVESEEGEAAASSSAAGESGGTTEAGPATTVETGDESSGGGASPGSAPDPTKSKVTFFSYAIDVRIVPVSAGGGQPSQAEPSVRRDLPPLVMLPSRDTPALTYIGPSRDGKKAIMLVSDEVTALFGDSNCIVGSQNCQMLALEPELPETVVFGPQARTYRIELLKIQIELSKHLNRAALGKPKHSGQPKSPGKSG